eukprot:822203-Amphidinium_carterae.1
MPCGVVARLSMSGQVDAYNSLERLFCALGLTMGLLLCSTVISSLSAAFIEFQMDLAAAT